MADYIPKKQEDMKRLLFILGLFVCIGLHAQNDILPEIEKGNAAYNYKYDAHISFDCAMSSVLNRF